MKNKLSMILPTYNEALNIRPLIDEIIKYVENIHEIIVVDDNSPDGTAEIVEDMIKSGGYPFLKIERRINKRCLTASIQKGIDISTGDAVGWMDCDFSMPPKYIPVLLSLINADYDVAAGSRFVLGANWRGPKEYRNERFSEVFLSKAMNLFIQICLDHRFRDYTSGFVVAKKEVLKKIRLNGDYGEYFIDFIYHSLKLNYRVVEVPYVWMPRRAGYSKTGTNISDYYKRGVKYIFTTVRLLTSNRF